VKPLLIVPTMGSARWVELPEVIVISAEWLQANFGPRPSELYERKRQEKPDDDAG